MQRTIAIAFTLLFAGMALAGCASNNNGSGGAGGGTGAPNKDVFTTLSISEAESLDPGYDYESAGGQVLQNVYDTLYWYQRGTDSAEVHPQLASAEPTYNANKSELTIPLRTDVKFHDGNPMTAADVKFSLDRMIIMNDPDGPAAIYASIKGANAYFSSDMKDADRATYLAAGGLTVVDDHTVKIALDFPDPAILPKLAFTPGSIVEKAWACKNKAADDTADCFPAVGKTREPYLNEHEMGTGPFMLDNWAKGQQLVLKRWDQYWGDKAKVQQVIIKKVDDFNTRLLALKDGSADDVYIPVDHEADLTGVQGIHVVDKPSFTVAFLGFNQRFCGGNPDPSDPKFANKTELFTKCMAENSADAPKGSNGAPDVNFFADKNMRLAWINVFDYDTYFNSILNKHGVMLNGVIPKGLPGYDASFPQFKRDVNKAKDYYAKTNHSDGFSLTIFFNSGNTVREKTAALLAQNLRDLGPNINVKTQGLDFSTAFLAKQRASALPIFYLGWAPDYAFPDDYTTPFAHSTLGVYAKRVHYSNPDMDKLLENLMKEPDQAKLNEGYSKATKMLNDDAAYIFLAQASNMHVERDWVRGWYYNPMHTGDPNVGDYATVSKV